MVDDQTRDAYTILKEKNMRLSHHRVMILDYLSQSKSHPTVDNIYLHLKDRSPSLSRTTIYNTLSAFIDAGLARPVRIEDNELRYDYDTSDHVHFKCVSCGKVTDFDVELSEKPAELLQDYMIQSRDVFYSGICPECRKNNYQ